MDFKVLTETCSFTCKSNPSILIKAKNLISKAKDCHGIILTDTAVCNVNIPLPCTYLTQASGGTAPVPCALNAALTVNWQNVSSKIKINGHGVLTSKSCCNCPVDPRGVISVSQFFPLNNKTNIVTMAAPVFFEDKSTAFCDTEYTQDENKYDKDNKTAADSPESENFVSKSGSVTDKSNEEINAFASYCRCDYENCGKRESCRYYNTQIFTHNDSVRLRNNFKHNRADEWNDYIKKHNEKLASSPEGGWGTAAHHLISGKQILMMKDSENNLLYGDIVKLSNYFGYDINNEYNCIILPTNEGDFEGKDSISKFAAAYDVMGIMGRQWHVGGHEYTLSKDTLDNLKEYYTKNISQYPSVGNPMFFMNYKTAVKEEMDKLQCGIRDQCWEKNYGKKREKFVKSLNGISKAIEEKLLAFEKDPRKSFPYFVSRAAVEYSYNIPKSAKIIVIYVEKSGLTAKKYRVERYLKNDLNIIFNYKGETAAINDKQFVNFCENIMYFFIDDRTDYRLPFEPDEVDPFVVKHMSFEDDIDSALYKSRNEVAAFIQNDIKRYQPISRIVSHRYERLPENKNNQGEEY